MNQTIHHRQYSAGLSLIELMVALAVSAIMLLGVTTIYTASKRSYQVNNEMAAIQENARYALHTLTNDIRMAGNTGCQNIKNIKINVLTTQPKRPPGFSIVTGTDDGTVPPPVSNYNLNSYITGHTFNGAWTPAFEPGLTPGNVVLNSDAITIRSVSACSSSVTRNTGTSLNVDGDCVFNNGDVVIVADCENADMFTVTGGAAKTDSNPYLLNYSGGDNKPNTLSKQYTTDASVFKANTVVYYIGQDASVPPQKGLYAKRLVNDGGAYKAQEGLLIPNAENMAITYGLDTNGDPGLSVDTEMFASAIEAKGMILIQGAIQQDIDEGRPAKIAATTPWSRVTRVRLQLLLASEPIGTTLKPAFTFNAIAIPADTRSRRVFDTSINIRARTP